MTGGSEDTISMDMVRSAFSTDARLAIAPMQDFLGLGSEARFNTPGTSTDNWRWRLNVTQLTDGFCENVEKAVRGTGRELPDDRYQANG